MLVAPKPLALFKSTKKVMQMAKCELCNKTIKPWYELCVGCSRIKSGNRESIAALMA